MMATPITPAPSPFTPPRTPDDPTLSHLLSLPPLLQPISPSLAALHMARVRLLLDIPSSSSVGVMSEWWCHACGGLREGLGGAQRPRARERPATTAAGKKGASAKKRSKVTATAGLAGGVKRKAAECANCGAKFTKAKPDRNTLVTYPSARIAARRRREQAETQQATDPFVVQERVQTSSSKAIGMDIDIDTDMDSPTPGPSTPGTTGTDIRGTTTTQVASTTLAIGKKPSFARVRDTEPNLPTYPQPAASTSPEKPKKRKKKSGLAKLLAENKERAAAQNMGGTWGLG